MSKPMSLECMARHDLFVTDMGRDCLHWTGVHFSYALTDAMVDAAVPETIKLRAKDRERLLKRWEDFKQANKFVDDMMSWLYGKIGTGPESIVERGLKYISNFDLMVCLSEYRLTDQVPLEMQQRWAEAQKVIKEVYDDYLYCEVTRLEDGSLNYNLKPIK